jgi:chemotaxis protein MotB
MQATNKTTICLLTYFVSTLLFSGCGGFPTNWKTKHDKVNVAYQNCVGERQGLRDDKRTLQRRLAEGNKTIAELQRELDEGKRAPDLGFGSEYDVRFDPAAGTITVTLPNTILFAAGKAEVKGSSSALNHIESVLESQHAGRQIDVLGHTDSTPIKASGWDDNWELSAQRALSVVRYLIKRGVPEKSIRAVACGAARPIASNATASGKAKNRRVEIVVHVR